MGIKGEVTLIEVWGRAPEPEWDDSAAVYLEVNALFSELTLDQAEAVLVELTEAIAAAKGEK